MSLLSFVTASFKSFLDLPDPKPIHGDGGLPKVPFHGPLKAGGVAPGDVMQGQLANCYFPAAVASMAQLMKDDLHKTMKRNDNGTFTFKFWQKSDGQWQQHQVTVDPELYVNQQGAPKYGATTGKLTPEHMELWYPLMEKAYAKFLGSYGTLNQGGFSSEVISALTGRRPRSISINPKRDDKLWTEITAAVDEGRAAAFGTHSDGRKMKGSGLIDDHAYSLLGYSENEAGEKFVKVRNPWGSVEAKAKSKSDTKDDGIFSIPLEVAAKYFETFDTVA